MQRNNKVKAVVILSLTGILAGLLAGYAESTNTNNNSTTNNTSTTATAATTTATATAIHCYLQSGNSLPDPKCTPGAVSSAVSQDNIQQTICVPGYSKTVRPPVSYTDAVKDKVMAQYGLIAGTIAKKDIELDHLIPLELGGNPTSEQNLWPEPRLHTDATYPASSKDVLENYYHRQVCDGNISLAAAQYAMASGSWINGVK